MDKGERETLAVRVAGFAGAGVASEAIVFDHDLGLTRFTHNAIHQNVAQSHTSVRVRTIVDGRTGVASTNALDEESLRATVARAMALAAFAPHDDAAAGLVASDSVTAPAGAFDEATARADPAARAEVARAVFAAAEGSGLWAAGYVTSDRSGLTVANSAGTLASYDGTSCAINVKANGPDATGFAETHAVGLAALDGEQTGGVAAAKAVAARKPRAVDPGAWTVILESAAAGELLSYFTDHFSAQAYEQGSSFLSGNLEAARAVTSLSLIDDYAHPLFAGRPFDFEGYPTRRVPLLEGGVAALVTDATWAKRLARPNTGHGSPAPNAAGPSPHYVVAGGGSKSKAELIAETKRGLLITRFWYIRPVDQKRTIVTGMTRDGTFLIENGEIVCGVRNMRFNQSILDALARAEMAVEPVRTGGYGYDMVAPAIKIEAFHFTSGTDF
jgi:predicted Zn-dependent protease